MSNLTSRIYLLLVQFWKDKFLFLLLASEPTKKKKEFLKNIYWLF